MADQYDVMAHTVMRQFPGWVVFFGTATRSWWALPPADHRPQRLIEARTVDDLVRAIRAGWPPAVAPPGGVAATVPIPVIPTFGGPVR